MTPATLYRIGWAMIAVALLATPAKALMLRGWLQSMVADGAAMQGWAHAIVVGAMVAAILALIAAMPFTLARQMAAADAANPGVRP
ncbi:MAG: hypothetical protein Q4F49_04320 [Pseudoxanthomonas suwonensis]|nr:hypothetical protein [Pseudoxanthomonas suwonensis]